MTVVWGIVGMAVDVLLAAQLMWPALLIVVALGMWTLAWPLVMRLSVGHGVH